MAKRLQRNSWKTSFLPSFLPSFPSLGAAAEGELWPPEQSAFILIHPRLTAWFLNNLLFIV
jgi:hypothetical protein